jgi:hypothetical protein
LGKGSEMKFNAFPYPDHNSIYPILLQGMLVGILRGQMALDSSDGHIARWGENVDIEIEGPQCSFSV